MHANDFDYNFCQRCGYKKETSVISVQSKFLGGEGVADGEGAAVKGA